MDTYQQNQNQYFADFKAKLTRDTVPKKETEGQSPTGKGYGSAGSKLAGELGRYIKKKLNEKCYQS